MLAGLISFPSWCQSNHSHHMSLALLTLAIATVWFRVCSDTRVPSANVRNGILCAFLRMSACLSAAPCVSLTVCMAVPVYVSLCLSLCVSLVCLIVCLFVRLFACLFVCLFAYFLVYLFVCLFVCLPGVCPHIRGRVSPACGSD